MTRVSVRLLSKKKCVSVSIFPHDVRGVICKLQIMVLKPPALSPSRPLGLCINVTNSDFFRKLDWHLVTLKYAAFYHCHYQAKLIYAALLGCVFQ